MTGIQVSAGHGMRTTVSELDGIWKLTNIARSGSSTYVPESLRAGLTKSRL